MASSTVVITPPNKDKITYVLSKKGEWIEGGETIKPAFVEEYNMAGAGMNIGCLIACCLIYAPGFDKNAYDTALNECFKAEPIGYGYYKNQYVQEVGNGMGESGKIVETGKRNPPLRQHFDSNKEYRVEFTPKLSSIIWGEDGGFRGFDDTPEAYKRYVYICRIIPSNNVDGWGPGGYMVNKDCSLTTQEEVEQFLQNVGIKEIIDGPEFMFAYSNYKDDPYTEDGVTSWISDIWTTKECEVFILNISEA